jgi:hypothetical protein
MATLMNLPRELRDEIMAYLTSDIVYTSTERPDTANLYRTSEHAKTYVDTRIYLPCAISSGILGVCRQLRDECLDHHTHLLNLLPVSSALAPSQDTAVRSRSHVLAARRGNEDDEEAERIGDCGMRITIEAQRAVRGQQGYYIPRREELSPRFLALLPFMQRAKKLRLVVWPGYDWWNGSKPRAVRRLNGRLRLIEEDTDTQPVKPDAVSFAIGKILERLPAVEELTVDLLMNAGDVVRWDLPDRVWDNMQYWLDGAVAHEGTSALRKVVRRLAAVWEPTKIEVFYTQQETRIDDGKAWHVQRKGDMRTVSLQCFVQSQLELTRQPAMVTKAEPGELDALGEPVDEEFDRND